MLRDAGRFIRTTPLVRGLLIGAVGAFAAGGAVVGSAQSYAKSVLAGQAGFGLLFAAVFVGLSLGIAFAPRLAARLAHERFFGVAIVLAGLSLVLVALSPHLVVSMVAVVLVGACAGATFLTGVTIIGSQVDDAVRGRVNAIYQALLKIVLGCAVALVPLLVGLTQARPVHIFGREAQVDGTRPVLLGAALLACVAGLAAYRQMNSRRPVRILVDLRTVVRRRARRTRGFVVTVEGRSSADTAVHAAALADWLGRAGVRRVVFVPDPGPDDPRFRALVSGASLTSARARVLAAAAVRADSVDRDVRPALDEGAVVVLERLIDSSSDRLSPFAGLDADDLADLADWAAGRLRPDFAVLLESNLESNLETNEEDQTSSAEPWNRRIQELFGELSNATRCILIEAADRTSSQDQIRSAVAEALSRSSREWADRLRETSGRIDGRPRHSDVIG
jgi:dTMP kinase